MAYQLICQGIPYAVAAGVVYAGTSFVRALANDKHIHDCRFGKCTSARLPAGPNFFVNKDGLQIFWRRWFPKGNKPKGIVVLCHGMAEHSGRYETFASFLTAAGFAVYALDHQGHGASEGDRVHIQKFDDFTQDVLQFTNIVKERHPELRNSFFLIGHSMGALISIHTALANLGQWAGVVLSGAPLKPDPKVASPFLIAVAHFLSNILPKLPLDKLPPDGLCTDKAVVQNYRAYIECVCSFVFLKSGIDGPLIPLKYSSKTNFLT